MADQSLREKAEKLQEKYADLLENVCAEERGKRYGLLRSRPERDAFVLDMLEFCGVMPDRDALAKDPGAPLALNFGLSARTGLGRPYRGGYVEGMEALWEAIEKYDQSRGTFAAWMYGLYQNKAKEAAQKLAVDRSGICLAGKSAAILQAIRELGLENGYDETGRETAAGAWEPEGGMGQDLALMVAKVREHLPEAEQVRDKKIVEHILYALNTGRPRPLIEERGEDDGEQELDNSGYQAVLDAILAEQKEEEHQWFAAVLELLESLLRLTLGEMDIREKPKATYTDKKLLIRFYLTRNILKELKLVRLTEKETRLAEAAPGRRALFEKIPSEKTVYYKWAPPAGEAYPAGNQEIYELLCLQEAALMRIMRRDYCRAAVSAGPEDRSTLYGLYFNRVQDSFCFDDSFDPAIFNPNNLSSFSKWQSRVREFLHAFRDQVLEGMSDSELEEARRKLAARKREARKKIQEKRINDASPVLF